nr:hypothetical protein [Desulfobacterales bacterium]
MILPEDFEKNRKRIAAAFKGPYDRMTIEYRIRCRDGSIKNIFENVTLIWDESGREW